MDCGLCTASNGACSSSWCPWQAMICDCVLLLLVHAHPLSVLGRLWTVACVLPLMVHALPLGVLGML